jgi:hypothetical protein
MEPLHLCGIFLLLIFFSISLPLIPAEVDLKENFEDTWNISQIHYKFFHL